MHEKIGMSGDSNNRVDNLNASYRQFREVRTTLRNVSLIQGLFKFRHLEPLICTGFSFKSEVNFCFNKNPILVMNKISRRPAGSTYSKEGCEELKEQPYTQLK